jgi:hypothetical protein
MTAASKKLATAADLASFDKAMEVIGGDLVPKPLRRSSMAMRRARSSLS